MNKYLLKYHVFYYQRICELKEQIKKLYIKLDKKKFIQHELVKFAYRIREADQRIIPQDPNRPEYQLKGELRKYRRYKRGFQRYRLFFCFSEHPGIILYLYLNSKKELRKAGDKNDPYEKFKKFISKGNFSHDPDNPKIQKWIKNCRSD